MAPLQSAPKIIWLDTAESTNKCIREASGSLDNLSVVAAVSQTAGRGQGDHTWFSTPGKNLTFSMLFRPAGLAVADAGSISCAVALGIRDYLLARGVTARIKWPNDLWVGEKKICGMLIENILSGPAVKESIIGIGLNLNEENWPAELPNPVSLLELTGVRTDPREELPVLAERICRRLELAGTPGGRLKLQEEFERYVFRLS